MRETFNLSITNRTKFIRKQFCHTKLNINFHPPDFTFFNYKKIYMFLQQSVNEHKVKTDYMQYITI